MRAPLARYRRCPNKITVAVNRVTGGIEVIALRGPGPERTDTTPDRSAASRLEYHRLQAEPPEPQPGGNIDVSHVTVAD